MSGQGAGSSDDFQNKPLGQPENVLQQLAAPKPQLEKLGEYVTALNAGELPTVLEGVTAIRKLLSVEQNPPINEVIATGIVPRLVALLSEHGNGREHKRIAFEAGWALTNIAGGTHENTRVVIDSGGVDAAMDALQPPATGLLKEDVDMIEQCVWLIGNIMGDGPAQRDLLINRGVVVKMLPILEAVSSNFAGVTVSLQRNVTWATSNMMRGKPEPDWAKVTPVIPACVRLAQCPDDDTRTDALWALSYCTEPNEMSEVCRRAGARSACTVFPHGITPPLLTSVQLVVTTGGPDFCRFLAEQILNPNKNIATPALRVTGNIVSGTEAVTQALLDAGVMPALFQLARNGANNHKKEAFWALSNISAGSEAQALALLHGGLVSLCCEGFGMKRDIAKESLWAISNLSNAVALHMLPEVQQNVRAIGEYIARTWQENDGRLSMVACEFLENMLKADAPNAEAPDSLQALLAAVPDFVEAFVNCQHFDHSRLLRLGAQWADGVAEADDEEPEGDAADEQDAEHAGVGGPMAVGGVGGFNFGMAPLMANDHAMVQNPAPPSEVVEQVAQTFGSITIEEDEDDADAR